MNRKSLSLGVLTLVCLGLGVVHGQPPVTGSGSGGSLPYPGNSAVDGPDGRPSSSGPPPLGSATVPLTAPAGPPEPQHCLSRWIQGTNPDCCGPLGDHTPLKTELFLRSGLTFPMGDGVLAKSLDTGWSIQGGWRALFFNDVGNLAWTFDLSLLNVHNVAGEEATPVLLRNIDITVGQSRVVLPEVQATVRAWNRTFVNFGSGVEYYLMGSAHGTRQGGSSTWRVGFDAGGRWGTCKLELFEIRHLTDTIAGAYAAIHSDYEIPCGCCVYYAGLRAEYDYTWSDVLQIQNKSDAHGVNLMWSVGVRY